MRAARSSPAIIKTKAAENYTFDRTYDQGGVVASRQFGQDLVKFWYYERDVFIVTANVTDLFPTKPGALRYVQYVPTHEQGWSTALNAPLSSNVALDVLFDQRYVGGYSDQRGPTGLLQANGTGTELEQAFGLQATVELKRFELIAGARADLSTYNSLVLTTVSSGATNTTSVPGYQEGAISPRAALRYDLTPQLAVRVSSGAGFRTPYLDGENFVRGYNIGKVAYEPNPFLVPERSTTDDAGLDYLAGSRGRLSFDVFQTKVNNAIDFVTLSPTAVKRENVEQTQSDGETLTYAQRLGACPRLSLWGTGQNARITSGPGADGRQAIVVRARRLRRDHARRSGERSVFVFAASGVQRADLRRRHRTAAARRGPAARRDRAGGACGGPGTGLDER